MWRHMQNDMELWYRTSAASVRTLPRKALGAFIVVAFLTTMRPSWDTAGGCVLTVRWRRRASGGGRSALEVRRLPAFIFFNL